ncbi:MAG: hypothetical protein DMG65_06665 [Candidatus Angelobacter sp. Gp1-AA117]|nr:MAG: hypothetical protein DMG65_06665 [Candidatus Angelobacter sp. Gp1-AA117]
MCVEHLPYRGESPKDNFAFQRYRDEIARGKSLLQLTSMAAAVTPWVRQNWSSRTFTKVVTPAGEFDDLICNVSYHFHKHGAKLGSISNMTQVARDYFKTHRHLATLRPDGTLELPGGLFELDGRIITWWDEL